MVENLSQRDPQASVRVIYYVFGENNLVSLNLSLFVVVVF